MKEVLKVVGILAAIIIIFFGLKYYQTATLERALQNSNLEYSYILYQMPYEDNVYIFYSKINSTGLVAFHKYWYGYRQINTAIDLVYEPNLQVSWVGSSVRDPLNDELQSIYFGNVYDSTIQSLTLKLRHGDEQAEIFETANGRIWYCFPKEEARYSPEIIATYENGQSEKVW